MADSYGGVEWAKSPARPDPKGTIRVQPRYTMECETCGWRSYPYLEEDAVIGEWREHVRDHRGAHIDGPEAQS